MEKVTEVKRRQVWGKVLRYEKSWQRQRGPDLLLLPPPKGGWLPFSGMCILLSHIVLFLLIQRVDLGCMGIHCNLWQTSLVPRPFKRKRRKGLVHTACACAGVSIATSRITIVIVRGFCMTYSSMDNKRRVYDSIRLPHIFLGSPGACACSEYQALSPPPREGPGYEANGKHSLIRIRDQPSLTTTTTTLTPTH